MTLLGLLALSKWSQQSHGALKLHDVPHCVLNGLALLDCWGKVAVGEILLVGVTGVGRAL